MSSKLTDFKRHLIKKWPLPNKFRIANLLIPFNGKSLTNVETEISFLEPSLFLYANPQSYIEYSVFCTGDYEPEIHYIIKSLVKAGDTVVDIGANIGVHTLRMSLYAGNTGKVYAFEPIEDLVQKLNANVALNSLTNVHIQPYALSDVNEVTRVRFFEGHSNQGITSLAMTDSPNRTIQVKRGDDVVRELGLDRIHFMKIDVEGFEWNVIKGFEQAIYTSRPKIIFEFGKSLLERYPEKDIREQMIVYFQGLNYNLFVIKYLGLKKIALPADFDDFCNILCLPK
jgi:FkbM family methyltransferase